MLPFLIVVVAYLLVAAMIAIGVVGFNPAALTPLFRAPRQFALLLVSRRMRRNHALEHATINVVSERYRRSALTGMPDREGFHLRGRLDPDALVASGQQAIERLRNGEKRLAIHRRCPTSLVGAQLLLAILFTVALLLIDQFSAPTFLAALLGAAVLGPPVSPILQRVALVDPNVGQLEVRDIEVEEPHGRLAMISFLVFNPIFVRTGRAREGGWFRERRDGEVTLITPDEQEIAAGGYRVRD
jgi:hypothetical protein